jgi:hypothetical protein
MFTIFLKSGIITSKPSTEIEANNYDDKLLVENVKKSSC